MLKLVVAQAEPFVFESLVGGLQERGEAARFVRQKQRLCLQSDILLCFGRCASMGSGRSDDREAVVWTCHDELVLFVFESRQGRFGQDAVDALGVPSLRDQLRWKAVRVQRHLPAFQLRNERGLVVAKEC